MHTTRKRLISDVPQLEMTPMIDVVFQLLIFFIVAIKQEDILAHLTVARPGVPVRQEEVAVSPIEIEVNRAGILLHGRAVDRAGLERQLVILAAFAPKSSVIIRCTADSRHASLVQALDTCEQAGLRNLSVLSM
jgi:biopolymer transport protein ExbD